MSDTVFAAEMVERRSGVPWAMLTQWVERRVIVPSELGMRGGPFTWDERECVIARRLYDLQQASPSVSTQLLTKVADLLRDCGPDDCVMVRGDLAARLSPDEALALAEDPPRPNLLLIAAP